ncbi:MAG: fumarylacetoacetase [Nocardioidaceae bacterium]
MTEPAATSWVKGAAGSGHDVDHLPYAVFSVNEDQPRVGARIGDQVVDLAPIAAADMLAGAEMFAQPTLGLLMSAGRTTWASTREWLRGLLTDPAERDLVEPHLVAITDVALHEPFAVADYVDFYCSLDHASNVGRIFRPDAEPLLPNWRHLPVGYHGRAGTVVISGTDVVRPCGQRKLAGSTTPEYGPSQRLDIEAELGIVVGAGSRLGERVRTDEFAQHAFGVTLLNDWSARDIQAWEYVPLGPFLGKSFATSISPWVTPLAALEAARVSLPGQDPEPLAYLRTADPAGYDIDMAVSINGTVVSHPPYASMYWSPAQMLAHLTANGASLRTGDLFASGTVSGPERHQRGSLLELSWGGTEPVALDGGGCRTFLEDGDVVTLSATAPGLLGGRLQLGDVTGRIVPARP